MAEQDRYGSHLGANPTNKESHLPSPPQGSGAEQDRFGGWFGGGKGPAAAKEVSDKLPQTSGAEQDRFSGWFGGGKGAGAAKEVSDRLPQASGAEQDRLGGWFGGGKGSAAAKEASDKLPRTSGAEQDRYGGWFGNGKGAAATKEFSDRLPHVSGAEQDRYNNHWGDGRGAAAVREVSDRLPHVSGAEQDRYANHWGDGKGAAAAHELSGRLPKTSGAEQDRYEGWFGGGRGGKVARDISGNLPPASGAEQDRLGSHLSISPNNPIPLNASTAVGLLQTAVLPSFGLHAGLSTVAYGVARYTDRVEVKDFLWPSSQVANAWWSSVGLRVVYDGLSPSEAWSTLTYAQKALLLGATVWGGRLLYRVASRSARRRRSGGERDDPRYTAAKKEDSRFWDRAFFKLFLPEAVFQTLVTLPLTLPFRAAPLSAAESPLLSSSVPASAVHSVAVFLFTAGLTTEVLADAQLETHSREKGDSELNREGVWSVVRHPNYLGDTLVHLSFPVLLLGAGLLHPLAALGPVANYVFLRFVGGDRETEAHQEKRYAAENPAKLAQLREYRASKNSFWPSPTEAANRWTWIVIAAGTVGVVAERGIRALL